MHHMLVPTDFSEPSRAALSYAVDLARRLGGRLTVLHVIYADKLKEELQGMEAMGYLSAAREQSGDWPRPSDETEWKRVARLRLEQGIDASLRDGVPIELAVEMGRPSAAIVQYARAHDVDLIVMGTQGRGPVARFFIGSVTENVLRSAACPVLVVPAAAGAKPPSATLATDG